MPGAAAAGEPAPFSGVEFLVPLERHVARVLVRGRGRYSRREILVDGVRLGTPPSAFSYERWSQLEFEREGHRCVVATVLDIRDSHTNRVRVFADGVDLRDGRTLDEWRRRGDDVLDKWGFVMARGPTGPFPAWAWVLALVVASALLLAPASNGYGLLSSLLVLHFVAVLDGWGEIDRWITSRHEWGWWSRLALLSAGCFGALVPPMAFLVMFVFRAPRVAGRSRTLFRLYRLGENPLRHWSASA